NVVFEAAEPTVADEILARIASGEARFAAALYEPEGRFRPDAIAATATAADGGWRVSGRKALVMDGADADGIVVSARGDDGTAGLFLVEGNAAGLSRTGYRTIDDFAAADLVFDDVEARAIALGAAVEEGILSGIDRAITALGAEAT